MNRDPTVVGRAKVGAELIAEVINGFVEPISWKTLVRLSSLILFLLPPFKYTLQAFTLSSLAFMTLFVNSLLSLFRSKLSTPSIQQQQQPLLYPPHPSRGFSWRGDDDDDGDESFKTPSSRRRRRLENGAAAKIS